MERFDPPDAAAKEMLDAWHAVLQARASSGDEEAHRRLAIVDELRADLDHLLEQESPPKAVSRFVARDLWSRFAHVTPAQKWLNYALSGAAIVVGATVLGLFPDDFSPPYVVSIGVGVAIALTGYLYLRRNIP